MLAVKLVLASGGGISRLCILHEKRPAVTLRDILEDCDYLKEARATACLVLLPNAQAINLVSKEYTTQVLSALNAVHTASLIHRGIDLYSIGLIAPSTTCPTVSGQQGQPKRVKLFRVAYYVQLLDMNRSEPAIVNGTREVHPGLIMTGTLFK